METTELTERRKLISWLALGCGAASFFLLLTPRGPVLSLQYSVGMAILTVLCFRWWSNPVHSGILAYLSPHTIILVHSFFYFGPGSLPRMAFPRAEMIGLHNIGADEYYLPTLFLAISGLLVFDLVYRKTSLKLQAEARVREGIDHFNSPEMQSFLPVISVFWYCVCLGVFVYMTRSYVLHSYVFKGVQGAIDNIFFQSGYWLVGTAWIMMSVLLFKPGSVLAKISIGGLLGFLLPIIFAYQNRRLIVYCLAVTALMYLVYSKKPPRLKVVCWSALLALVAFFLMTSVKYTATTDPFLRRYVKEDRNLFRRTRKIIFSSQFLDTGPVKGMLVTGIFNRLNGLDWAAAIMGGRVNLGVPFLWGKHNLPAAAIIIPRVIWPGKPIPDIEGVVNRHFELAYFDQLATILGSAYADGGVFGVILSFAFLGGVFPLAVWFVFQRKDGMIVYLGSLLPLLSFETYVLRYPFEWFRWVLILMVMNSAVMSIRSVVGGRRVPVPTE